MAAPGLTQRRREMLHQAGVGGVGPSQLLAVQVLAGLIALVLVVAITRTLSVAGCRGVFRLFLPAPAATPRTAARARD